MRLIITLLSVITAVFAANMGDNVHFTLINTEMQTFNSVQEKLHEDEVLKVQLYPTGRKNARPSPKTPVWLWISVRDDRHSWVMPWQPGGGHSQQWIEVLLCHNQKSLELEAQTNTSKPLPMRWSVSTENVKLGRLAIMKSTPADVSYRRFSWNDTASVAVDLEVSVITGAEVCASLAVVRRCVTHPHQLTDSHMLQRVLFAKGARFSVSRDDAPDGFWLYLIPEADNTRCHATAHRGPGRLPLPAKTIKVTTQTRSFAAGGTTPSPRSDHELPSGDPLLAGPGESDWAGAPPPSECQVQLSECRRECSLG